MQDWIWICVIPCLRLILPTIITKRRKRQANTAPETQLKDKMVLDMKHEIIELQDTIKKLEKERDEFHDSVEKLEKKQVELETRLKQKR